MKIIFLMTAAIMFFTSAAEAVTVWEIRRACGADGKSYCPKAGYSDPMKTCLNKNFSKLKPSCKAVMGRINAGEKVKLF